MNTKQYLEQIARLGRDGTFEGHLIRAAMVEIAERALADLGTTTTTTTGQTTTTTTE